MITDKELSDAVGVLRSALNESRAKRMKQESKLVDVNSTLYHERYAMVIKGLRTDVADRDSYIKTMEVGIDAERYEKNKTIDELRTNYDSMYSSMVDENLKTMNDLEASYANNAQLSKALKEANTALYNAMEVVEALEAELSARKEDSRVLMQVVNIIKKWNSPSLVFAADAMNLIVPLVEDYLNAPEIQAITLQTPSMGTRVVPKDEEAVEDKQQKDTIDELKDFIRDQCGRVDDRDNRIEQLMVLNEALRVDIELAHNLSHDHIAGQDRSIEELKSTYRAYRDENDEMCSKIKELTHDLDARNKVIKDFKAIETKETDRLHADLNRLSKIRDELLQLYCDRCDQLEKIENCVKFIPKTPLINEITKIIQEE